MVGAMRIGPLRQPHRRMPDLVYHGIDDLEDRRRRTKARVDRQVAEFERDPLGAV